MTNHVSEISRRSGVMTASLSHVLDTLGENPLALANILAMVHYLRIYYIRIKAVPLEIMNSNNIPIESLYDASEFIISEMNNNKMSDDAEKFVFHCSNIWLLTLYSIIHPEGHIEKVRGIWERLVQHAEEAYEVYLDKFNWHVDSDSEVAAQLISTLQEDFKKIPAALR